MNITPYAKKGEAKRQLIYFENCTTFFEDKNSPGFLFAENESNTFVAKIDYHEGNDDSGQYWSLFDPVI